MMIYFLDTSAVVKRYVQEIGSVWIRNLAVASAGNYLYVSRITDVELTAAIARRRRLGSLSVVEAVSARNEFLKHFTGHYRIVELSISLLQQASHLADTHALRAYDAVQLAAAIEIHRQIQSLTIVSADSDLNSAASAEGILVDNPNLHP